MGFFDESRECSRCGNTEEKPIDALGHNLGEWIIVEPTYTSEGYKQRICQRDGCNYSEEEIIPKLKYSSTNPTLADTIVTYDGKSHSITINAQGSGGTTQYRTSTNNSSWGNWSTTVPGLTNAGTLYVQARVIGDENHSDTEPTASKKIQIIKKDIQRKAEDPDVVEYNGTAQTFTLNVTEPTTGYTIYYNTTTQLTSSNYSSASGTTTTKPTRTEAGTTTVYWYIHSSNTNYSDVSGTNTIKVTKLDKPTITITSGTVGNNGWYRSNVTVKLTGNPSTIVYSISGSSTVAATTISSGSTFTISTEGTHTITAYTKSGDNKSENATLTIKIDKTPPFCEFRRVKMIFRGLLD